LTPEAHELLIGFAEKVEPMLTNELSDIADWAGKLVGTVLRIAGLLYVAECVPLYCEGDLLLDEINMQSAIIIGEYFLEHAKAAYQMMGTDENVSNANYILRKLKNQNLVQFTKRELIRMCRKFKSTELLTAPLKVLEDHNYIRDNGKLYILNPDA
jgi:hypothetical protein